MRLIKKNIRKGTNPGGDGMRFIGITGGVGAGKSAILAHLASKPGIRVMLADEIAHDLMQPRTDRWTVRSLQLSSFPMTGKEKN